MQSNLHLCLVMFQGHHCNLLCCVHLLVLGFLLGFCRDQYPIYLKATGGLHALPHLYLLRLMNIICKLFSTTTFNPYFFETDHACVINGEEEEAIYGWAAVNFAMHSFLSNSQGTGEAIAPANLTYGVLEMGSASMQILYFEPNRDVMFNLFKLQIGSALALECLCSLLFGMFWCLCVCVCALDSWLFATM